MDCSTVILAGGESRRMGVDKRALPWDGETLLEHVIRGFDGCGEVLLSLREGTAPDGCMLPVVTDRFPGSGPLAGIHAALLSMRSEVLFAAACDMPLADGAAARALLPLLEGYDAVVPRGGDGRVQPLCALYRRSCAAAAEAMLRRGERRMRAFLEQLNVRYVSSAVFPRGELTLANLNTPEDAERLRVLLQSAGR